MYVCVCECEQLDNGIRLLLARDLYSIPRTTYPTTCIESRNLVFMT